MSIRIHVLPSSLGNVTCLVVSNVANPKRAAFVAKLKSIGQEVGLVPPIEIVSTNPIQTHLATSGELGLFEMSPYLRLVETRTTPYQTANDK